YDADPDMWNKIIPIFREAGHTVILATYRDERYDWTPLMDDFLERFSVPLYCTRGVAKKWYLEHFGPGKVDIWIDDNPYSIIQNSTISPDDLRKWRDGTLGLETAGDTRSDREI